MKKALILLAASMVAVSSVSFAQSIHSLSKDQVTKMFADHTFTTLPVTTLNGDVMNNTFTGYWGNDGKMKGSFANKPDNDPQSDDGTWMVKNDGSLCATWSHWDNGKQVCVHAYETKNAVIFINAENKLETIVLINDIKSGNQLS